MPDCRSGVFLDAQVSITRLQALVVSWNSWCCISWMSIRVTMAPPHEWHSTSVSMMLLYHFRFVAEKSSQNSDPVTYSYILVMLLHVGLLCFVSKLWTLQIQRFYEISTGVQLNALSSRLTLTWCWPINDIECHNRVLGTLLCNYDTNIAQEPWP